jgi:hypothetical protein
MARLELAGERGGFLVAAGARQRVPSAETNDGSRPAPDRLFAARDGRGAVALALQRLREDEEGREEPGSSSSAFSCSAIAASQSG